MNFVNSPVVNRKRHAYVEFGYDGVVLESMRFHCLNVGGGANTASGIAAVGGRVNIIELLLV
jgi:hypothetical protein